ncbi:MAG: AAA family ATPase [Chromatiales bacterium]|jgi:aminoglycoside phosphotransferase family enzyme/predicted kinase
MELTIEQQARLIDKLAVTLEQRFSACVTRIETHISVILLVADKAFKIKKPVNFGFLDFSTLQKRHFYCEEELRLNSRLVPDLYQSVVAIYGTAEQPALEAAGDAIEYMVQMQRFDQDGLLDRMIRKSALDAQQMDQLADRLAAFHLEIPAATDLDQPGKPADTEFAAIQNFEQIRPLLDQVINADSQKLQQLEDWTRQQCKELQPLMQQRKAEGFIRECHGDMHLGNIALIDSEITIFDGIEFNDSFRWIDVMSELAFLLMDLDSHDRADFAARVLNRYLEHTGDYAGLQLLHFYQVYRAMVRAKVSALRLGQADVEADERQQLSQAFNHLIELAAGYIQQQAEFLAITHGLSGSGKSYVSAILCEQQQAVRIRSDVERKRLYPKTEQRYSREATIATYQRLLKLGGLLLNSGYNVILDATYLRQQERQDAQQLAKHHNVPYYIIDLQSPTEVLEQRIRARATDSSEPSEATLDVLHMQIDKQEPLDSDEQDDALVITPDTDVAKLFETSFKK